MIFCLPKGRHSEGPHEIHLICAQNYSRGGVKWGRVCHAGVGWVMEGWGGVCHVGVGWGGSWRDEVQYVMQGWVGWSGVCHEGVGWGGVGYK